MGTVREVATARVAEWRGYSAWELANIADTPLHDDCGEGVGLLDNVRDNVAERVEWLLDNDFDLLPLTDWSDLAREVGDGAVPDYTSQRFRALVDLSAWDEDIADYGAPKTLVEGAGWCLYNVAFRLASRLLDELVADLTDGVTVTA